jgi:ABC-type phosphate/phosphonate transport system substrate-binding protein
MLAYRQDLPEAFKQALISASVAYDDAQGLKDMAISKFIPSKDEDYVFVRQLNDFKEKLQQQNP